MGRANESVKMRNRFNLSGKNEAESQFPACKINTLKAVNSPSSDLQTLLPLLKIMQHMQKKKCSTQYNH